MRRFRTATRWARTTAKYLRDIQKIADAVRKPSAARTKTSSVPQWSTGRCLGFGRLGGFFIVAHTTTDRAITVFVVDPPRAVVEIVGETVRRRRHCRQQGTVKKQLLQLFLSMWYDGVVPIAVECSPVQIDLGQFLVRHFLSIGITAAIQNSFDFHTGERGCSSNQLNHKYRGSPKADHRLGLRAAALHNRIQRLRLAADRQ